MEGLTGFLKGIFIGLSVIVPGMSAGTAALILRIYRPLVFALRHFELRRMAAVAAGTALGVLGGARGVGWLLETVPDHLGAALAGLVVTATWPVLKESVAAGNGHPDGGIRWSAVLLAAAGFAAVWWLTPDPLRPEGAGGSLWLFLAGVLSASAMLLPGVSGSTVLVILGEYGRLLHALNQLEIFLLAAFAAGVVAGLVGFVRLVALVLERHPDDALAALGGMMLGSVGLLMPVAPGLGEWISFGLGALVIVPMWYYGGSIREEEERP